MIVSHCPKPNKKVLLMSTAHSKSDVCEEAHKQPVAM